MMDICTTSAIMLSISSTALREGLLNLTALGQEVELMMKTFHLSFYKMEEELISHSVYKERGFIKVS